MTAHRCSTEYTAASFNASVALSPTAVSHPRDAGEVVDAVAYAREHGLRIAAQATGHNVAAHGSLEDALLVDCRHLQDIAIDPERRRVRVGAGVRWEQVTPRLSKLGLAALHGSSPDVGIAGYSLGGGMGWLARTHGLQANSVTAIEVVLADGRQIRTDATHEPDLFWALRGGNGNFGVVTAIEFAVYPIAELYAGALFFTHDHAAEVLRAWTRLLPLLPDAMMTWASLLNFPDLPEVPDFARGQALVVVHGVFQGEAAEGEELLGSLRDLGPVADTFAMVPPSELGDLAMDPREPLPFRSATALVDGLPDDAIDALIAASGLPMAMVQLRHMGGALDRVEAGAGARATLPGQVCVFALAVTPDANAALAGRMALDAIEAAVAPYRAGVYPNFVEAPSDARGFFDAATWARLRAVKGAYDPGDVMKGNHAIPPAAPARRPRRSAVAVLVALVALLCAALPAIASADSIAFVRDGDVWLSTPDFQREYRVTATGGYTDVSQADDGTMIALHGVRLHRLDRTGTVLADFDTPVSDTRPPGAKVFYGPYDPAVSPDGRQVAYSYYYMTTSQDPTCLPPTCVTQINEGGTGYSHADRQTAWDEPGFAKHSGWRYPIWVDDASTLLSDPTHLPNADVVLDTHHERQGSTGFMLRTWFSDYVDGNRHVGAGDATRAKDKLAYLTGDLGTSLTLYAVPSFPQAFPDGQARDADLPDVCYRYSGGDRLASPTFSPDGSRLAFTEGDGVHVVDVPSFAGGCTLDGASETTGATVIANATEPDWGPADVPAARPAVSPTPVPTAAPTVTPPARTCLVPKVTGLRVARAKRRLAKAGCRVGTRRHGRRVRRQSVKAGRTVAAGTTVRLTLGR